MKIYILVYFLVTYVSFSQTFTKCEEFDRNTFNACVSNNVQKKDHRADALFLLVSGGYQYSIPSYDEQLKGSWVIDASLGAIMNHNWIVGMNFDYWRAAIDDYYDPYINTTYKREFKGYGLSFFAKYRLYLFGKKLGIDFGAGIGGYSIGDGISSQNYTSTGYLNMSPRLGFNMKLYDFKTSGKNYSLNIYGDISYYSLSTFGENKQPFKIINFKIGPSINLYY